MRSFVTRRWSWKRTSEQPTSKKPEDEELRREVESLLKYEKPGDRFIEEPAMQAAARMIAQEKPESLLGKQLGA